MKEPTDAVYREVSACVDKWLLLHPDEIFFFEDILKFHDWKERTSKQALSKKLYYESKKPNPVLEKRGRGFRVLDKIADEIKWWEANGVPLDIKLPFGLEKYALIYPKSLILLFGTWGDGKTAWCYNVVFLNMERFTVSLFNSEMSPELIKTRMGDYGNYIPKPPPFKTYYRTGNFADVIDPEGLNVIDYLSVPSDKLYSVVDELKRILARLTSGIAVVALQKHPGVDLPYGGNPALFDPALAVGLEKGKLKIVKVRTPANPKINPQNMTFDFKLSKGINFYDVQTTIE